MENIVRLKKLAQSQGFNSVEAWVTALENKDIAQVKTYLYSVTLTEAACDHLNHMGIKCYVKGRCYKAIDDNDAFKQFQADFNYITTASMVNINKV